MTKKKNVQTPKKVSPFVKNLTSPLKRRALNKNKSPFPLRLLLNIEDGLKVTDIPEKGRGVITTRRFCKNDFIVEYKGELISHKIAVQREKELQDDAGSFMFFFKHKDKPMCIDATAESSDKGRLINHGASANLTPKVYDFYDGPRLGFVAARNIDPGEELVYDYADRRKHVVESFPWIKYRKNKAVRTTSSRNMTSAASSQVQTKHVVRRNTQALPVKKCPALDRLVTLLQTEKEKQKKRNAPIVCRIPLHKLPLDFIYEIQCKAIEKKGNLEISKAEDCQIPSSKVLDDLPNSNVPRQSKSIIKANIVNVDPVKTEASETEKIMKKEIAVVNRSIPLKTTMHLSPQLKFLVEICKTHQRTGSVCSLIHPKEISELAAHDSDLLGNEEDCTGSYVLKRTEANIVNQCLVAKSKFEDLSNVSGSPASKKNDNFSECLDICTIPSEQEEFVRCETSNAQIGAESSSKCFKNEPLSPGSAGATKFNALMSDFCAPVAGPEEIGSSVMSIEDPDFHCNLENLLNTSNSVDSKTNAKTENDAQFGDLLDFFVSPSQVSSVLPESIPVCHDSLSKESRIEDTVENTKDLFNTAGEENPEPCKKSLKSESDDVGHKKRQNKKEKQGPEEIGSSVMSIEDPDFHCNLENLLNTSNSVDSKTNAKTENDAQFGDLLDFFVSPEEIGSSVMSIEDPDFHCNLENLLNTSNSVDSKTNAKTENDAQFGDLLDFFVSPSQVSSVLPESIPVCHDSLSKESRIEDTVENTKDLFNTAGKENPEPCKKSLKSESDDVGHKKRQNKKEKQDELSFTEELKCCDRGKKMVRKIISIVAKNTKLPYAPELLQEANEVIKAIESLPVSGKTMLFYFTYCLKALKEMAVAHFPKAFGALQELQKYKDLHYQHYSKSTDKRKLSQPRKLFVDSYKTKFEEFILKVNAEMSEMEKPIKIILGTACGKKWTKVVGFLCLWVQEELGHEFYLKVSRKIVLEAKLQGGGEFFTLTFENHGGENVTKVISRRLHQCLLHYCNMRMWRLPHNNVFFVGVTGSAFTTSELNRYIPE